MHPLANVLGHVLQVAAVSLGQDHLGQARGVGRQDLLLQASDREHSSLEGDLAGHPDVVAHGPAAQERRERGGHCDPRAGAVLRDGPGGHVHVELAIRELVLVDAELLRAAAHERQRDPRGLLHDVAELSGQDEVVLAGHGRRLDEEDVPPALVTERPVATPGMAVRSAASWKNRCLPSASRTAATSTWIGGVTSPDAIRVAILRSALPSSRSRLRTPASRVYSVITLRIASSSMSTSSGRSPFRSRCRGHRYPVAIATFSSVV